MLTTPKVMMIVALVICLQSQKLYIHSPQQLKAKYPTGINVKISPIGYNPRSGQLDGTLVMAQPFDACSPIENVQNDEEGVFVLANDETCLQSVKSKNILKAGALVGLIRQNQNTTLHDKDMNIVHIPIGQIPPLIFDNITEVLMQGKTAITLTITFGTQRTLQDIHTELWMSPTETQVYQFLISMQKFFNNENNEVTFEPRYAMHSQKQRKTFIGCFSNGMYCPGQLEYDGKIQGQNIISESLRQIIIREVLGMEKWWKYIKYYYVQCLHNSQEDFMSSHRTLTICTRNSMMLAEIDYLDIQKRMNESFTGPRSQVDDNILLREQRQDYIREKVTNYPILLINKKEVAINDQHLVKVTICKMEHQRSTECSQLIDGQLKNSELFIILGIVLIIIVLILVGYKIFMYRRMQKQMKSEVTSTLQQYYRYMDTLEGDSEPSRPRIFTKQKPDSSNDIQQDVIKKQQQKQDPREIQIQLTPTSFEPKKNSKPSKQGHQTLVQQDGN